MQGPYLSRLPRPELGAAMERTNLNTMSEEALVISIIGSTNDEENWQAVLMTRNGVEFISSDVEQRSSFDWRPKGWIFHRKTNCFVPEGTTWDEENERFVAMDGDSVWDLPVPKKDEKYMTWKSRVMRVLPELKKESQAADILSNAWDARTAAAV